MEISENAVALLERIAVGVEKMGADPEIEFEVGPPLCPSCGEINPKINLPAQEGGMGRLAELIVESQCVECGAALYVVIESYSCHRSRETAVDEARARNKSEGWTHE